MRKALVGMAAIAAVMLVWAPSVAMADKQPAPKPASDKPATGKHAKPAKGSIPAFFIDSMVLIREGKFDQWVDKKCHKDLLCYNGNSVKSLKRYNLPAVHRRMKKKNTTCLQGKDDTIEFTRVEPYESKGHKGWQIYIKCGVSLPWPWYVVKAKDGYRSPKI